MENDHAFTDLKEVCERLSPIETVLKDCAQLSKKPFGSVIPPTGLSSRAVADAQNLLEEIRKTCGHLNDLLSKAKIVGCKSER
jgi:hypothetical protein